MFILELKDLDALIGALRRSGYTVIGPTVRDGAIVLEPLEGAAELPKGWTDVQAPGAYALEKLPSDEMFGYVVGPHSWKKFLFPPRASLFKAQRTSKGFEVMQGNGQEPPKYAFIGIRPCDLAALDTHDRIFMKGHYVDPTYRALREMLFTVAVNCTRPGGNCFCTSMDTGPVAQEGYDLSITEVLEGTAHYFVVDAGSSRGREILGEVPHREAEKHEEDSAHVRTARAAGNMPKSVDTENIKPMLYAAFEHAEWDEVAKRCLACTNCTMVCPTCFCSTVEDTTDLTGSRAERNKRWDSCFTMDYTKVAGGNVRPSKRARYRQWLTHKFAYWIDQFGTSGCVGCGRCITWCPVGIDVTAELGAIRRTSAQPAAR
jgi:ferredoxin